MDTVVKMAVDFLGPDRCLYGTDGPYGKQHPGEDYDYGWIKGRVENLSLSGRDADKVFGDNFEVVRKS